MNPIRWSRILRRLLLPTAAVALLAMFLYFGTERVPDGRLRLTDAYDPGVVCLIAKRPSTLRAGAVVFVATAGGTVIARVASADDTTVLFGERGASAFPEGVPRAAVRGVVLSVIGGTPAAELDGR